MSCSRFDRPEAMNPFKLETSDEMEAVIGDARDGVATRTLIIMRAERAICTRIDIAASQGQSAQGLNTSLKNPQKMTEASANTEKPVIAAVARVAAGAGCSVVPPCDMIIASSSATFVQNFVKIDLISDMGSMHFLPRVVSLARAKELLLTDTNYG